MNILRRLKYPARAALLLLVGAALVLLWLYCDMMVSQALRRAGIGGALLAVCTAASTCVVLAAAAALPIQSLFPKHALVAAACIGWMPLAAAVLLAWPADGASAPRALGWTIFSGCANCLAILIGAWLVARFRAAAVQA